jgi:hypothetical protein
MHKHTQTHTHTHTSFFDKHQNNDPSAGCGSFLLVGEAISRRRSINTVSMVLDLFHLARHGTKEGTTIPVV